MSQSVLGAAVIGLRMGGGHLEGFARNPHTRIVAICDTDPAILEKKNAEFKPKVAVTDYRKLLDNPEIQIVSVASPDYYHAEQSIACMRAGKDVLCEKPMTLDLAEARQIIGAVKETGRRFMIGQVCRFAPGFALAKKMIERGEIGELFLVESEYAHNYSHSEGVGGWRKDPRREPIVGGGCHAVDLLRWIAGDAEEVFAYSNHKAMPGWPVNDCTMAVFKFKSGVIGKAMCSIGCVRPYTMRSAFYGTQGTIICDNTSPEIQLCSNNNFTTKPAFATFPVDIASHNVAAEVAELVDCILNDKPVPTDVYAGARTVATCVAAVESARTGRPVKVEKV